jgi:sulfur carrier protein ThiS
LNVQVAVRLFANLADFTPLGARAGVALLEVPEDVTVGDLVRRLEIPDELPRLLLVNGQEAVPGRRLAPGDLVSVLPPLVGG